jgi:hypothetical protein
MSLVSASEFNLGEFLGIGLTTIEIGYLAGALFLGLFALAALRRASRAPGFLPIVWIAVALALLAGTLLVAARGFRDEIPDFLRPWTDQQRLMRAAAILALLGSSFVCISGHWIRGALARWIVRVAGIVQAGLAIWLASGWFSQELPTEIRPWTAETVIVRSVIVLSLACLAIAFWGRRTRGKPHQRWANRALALPAIAIAVILAWRWFGAALEPSLESARIERYAVILAAIATTTCLIISAGAYLLRDRPEVKRAPSRLAVDAKPPRSPRPLPIAVLLDDRGRPVLPNSGPAQSGPAGA